MQERLGTSLRTLPLCLSQATSLSLKNKKYVPRFAEAHQRQLFWVRTVFMEAVLPWLDFESCVCFPIYLQGCAL